MLILNVSVYPNGKKYVVEPHFPLQHLPIRMRSRLRVKIMSQNQNIPSKPQDSSTCCTKKPCKILLHWQFHLKSEIRKEKWHCFHACLSALIQFWVCHVPYIYSTEVCYTVSISIHLLRRPRYCLHNAIDWLFNACLLCLTTLQPQVSSQTYINTYAHKAPREECGICPGLRAKTREKKNLTAQSDSLPVECTEDPGRHHGSAERCW